METVLYADILFLVNFAMDFISLSASASLGAKSKKPLRISVAAALGAIYAIAVTVSEIGGLPQYILAASVGASMCIISFGFGGIVPFVRQCIIFWGCGALLGGIMTAVLTLGNIPMSKANLPVIAISAIVVLFFVIKAVRERAACKSLKFRVSLSGKSATFEALCDSGNMLRDVFTGVPVVLVSHMALKPLLSERAITAMLDCNTEELAVLPLKIRLIPRNATDSSSLVCAFCPDKVTVSSGTRTLSRQCLIAVSPHHNTYFAGFAATAPSVLIP